MSDLRIQAGDRVTTDCGHVVGTVIGTFCDGAIVRVRWDRERWDRPHVTDIGACVLELLPEPEVDYA